jgi:hypothetical protein
MATCRTKPPSPDGIQGRLHPRHALVQRQRLSFTPNELEDLSMSVRIRITSPHGPAKEREFENRREAAQYGVFFYLTDNGYATRPEATTAASTYQNTGQSSFGEFTFTDVTPKKAAPQ